MHWLAQLERGMLVVVLGSRGMLLNMYRRDFQVSYLAMRLEIARDGRQPGLVEIAELIELGLSTWQPKTKT